MKKIIFSIILMCFMVSVVSVNAESISSGYSLLIRKGEVTESFSTSEVTSDAKNIFNNTVSFSNSFIKVSNLKADRLSITDASATLSGPLSMTITGDNTINVLTLTSCSVSISGTGTLKFIPSFFGEEGIITSVEEQKQFVSSRIKTSLPITYEEGFVYINKKIVDSNSKEDVDNNTVEDNSQNKDDAAEVTKPNNNDNVNGTTNGNTSGTDKPKATPTPKPSVTPTPTPDVEQETNGTTNDNVTDNENNVADNKDNFSSDEDVIENETVNADDSNIENDENNGTTNGNKSNNLPLYIGVGAGSVAVVGLGTFIFRKIKH